MRQIKFRAWDDEAKKMYSAEELEQSEVTNPMDKTIYSYLSFGILCIYDFRKEEPLELIPLQFTGWLDKNNVEIYEGDLVLFQDNRYQVIWSEEISAFMLLSDEGSALLGGEHLIGELEVIGNQFERDS